MTQNPTATPVADATTRMSRWLTITQDMIHAFGASTLDADPIHDDFEWAARNSPYGGTIAYGFLTMSLLTHFFKEAAEDPNAVSSTETGYNLNYGFDRLRFVSPVPVGSRIRGCFTPLGQREDEKGRIIHCMSAVVEIEGRKQPALVAEWLAVSVPTG